MICVDTSVVVAAFSPWHDAHGAAISVMQGLPYTVSHCMLEVYSVLTRMPAPFRAPGDVAASYVQRQFGDRVLHPRLDTIEVLPARLAALGIVGGAAYDALIAETARVEAAQLVSLDRRAVRTYHRVGADYRLLATERT